MDCGAEHREWWRVAGAEEEDDGGEEHGDERGAEAEVEGGAVADGSDDAGGDGVAEGVDDEELTGHGGGADLGADGVEGGRVDRASAEEDEEDRQAEAERVREWGPKKQRSAGGTARAALIAGTR